MYKCNRSNTVPLSVTPVLLDPIYIPMIHKCTSLVDIIITGLCRLGHGVGALHFRRWRIYVLQLLPRDITQHIPLKPLYLIN